MSCVWWGILHKTKLNKTNKNTGGNQLSYSRMSIWKRKKNLKMQALGLGMCPVIIHITQEREFRLCFVTLRCGTGRSSQENHTCLQGNKLSNQNSESKASQPAFSSKRPTTRVDNVQLLRNTVPEV